MPLVLEEDLIAAARDGGSPLERLIIAVWPEAYRIAFVILRDRGLAEDTAQEACASIARSLPALERPERFAAWSYRIITNRAMSLARRRPRTSELESVRNKAIVSDNSEIIDLYVALSKLPLAQRASVVLHYYAGLNSREIAEATMLPASTIRFHLMLARRALQKMLDSPAAPATSRQPEEAVHHVH